MNHKGVARFDRVATLVTHGPNDRHGRPDAIEFVARTNQILVDWLAEAKVYASAWPTRAGLAELLEQHDGRWVLIAKSIPLDAIYLTRETQIHLIFGEYIPLVAGVRYRLYLPTAVLTKPTVWLAALQCERGDEESTIKQRRTRVPLRLKRPA